jgi:hypothetical protein
MTILKMHNMFCSNMFCIRTRLMARWSGVERIFNLGLVRKELLETSCASSERAGSFPRKHWAIDVIRSAPSSACLNADLSVPP